MELIQILVKNYGTFYQPKKVLIDISVLIIYQKKFLKSGYAELVKHALINDYSFFVGWKKKFK